MKKYIGSFIFFALGAFFLAHEMTYMWIAMGAVHLLIKPCYCRNCNNG
jgi:hypothetical protein